ncbi:hypothetical protein [Maledivibacter halophilus]|uniref:Uncharacterized protein n=1 Tax=Maledivibacter halophilus TaxID=36842 RepID=A0A1T5M529_9FIRM|nr:hypothetical protein [Maledivibacter halophilus]SKC82918.1 hypothetical protein SAMN02194393_03777 [Maledivibacter halophilus]
MTVLTGIFKSNRFKESMNKLEEINTKMKDWDSGAKRKLDLAKSMTDIIQGKKLKNNDNKKEANESENLFLNFIGKLKKTKKTVENTLGYVDDMQKYISPTLKKSTKASNLINNKFAPKAGKVVENMVNFAGKAVKKDLTKYANATKHVVETGTKNLFLGKAGPKQMKKLSSNPLAQAMYNKAVKFKDTTKKVTKNIDKYSLDDITKKGSELMGKGMKKINNPKAAGIMDKISDSKILGKIKNIGGNKFVKGLTKAFSPVGAAMNVHTMMTDESDFKKTMAALDFAGDFTPIAPVTSAISFVGGAAYDFLKDKSWGKPFTDGLDKGAGKGIELVGKGADWVGEAAGFIGSSVSKAGKNTWGFMKKGIKSGMNLAKEKTPAPIKKALKSYTDIYKKPIQRAKEAGKLLGDTIKNIFKKPSHKNTKDIYRKTPLPSKDMQAQIQHNGEVVQTKLQGSPIDNSTKNNFTINISGMNKTTEEIMDELVPQIKLRMKNISVA